MIKGQIASYFSCRKKRRQSIVFGKEEDGSKDSVAYSIKQESVTLNGVANIDSK